MPCNPPHLVTYPSLLMPSPPDQNCSANPWDLWGWCQAPAGRRMVPTHTCTWPHGDPRSTAPPWGTDPHWGGGVPTVEEHPHPARSPSATGLRPQSGHSIAFSQPPGHLPECHYLYVHIYDKTPKHEVYKNSMWGCPHTNSSRNPLQWGREPGQEACPQPPSPPDMGTLQGTAETQPRGEGDTGPRAVRERPGPPPNLCGHRPVGRYGTGQTNEQTAEG